MPAHQSANSSAVGLERRERPRRGRSSSPSTTAATPGRERVGRPRLAHRRPTGSRSRRSASRMQSRRSARMRWFHGTIHATGDGEVVRRTAARGRAPAGSGVVGGHGGRRARRSMRRSVTVRGGTGPSDRPRRSPCRAPGGVPCSAMLLRARRRGSPRCPGGSSACRRTSLDIGRRARSSERDQQQRRARPRSRAASAVRVLAERRVARARPRHRRPRTDRAASVALIRRAHG